MDSVIRQNDIQRCHWQRSEESHKSLLPRNSAFQSYYQQADSMTRDKSCYQLVDSMTEKRCHSDTK